MTITSRECRRWIVAIKFSNELFPLLMISDERDAIQKKTFTKWVNKHLKKVSSLLSVRRKVFFSFFSHFQRVSRSRWTYTYTHVRIQLIHNSKTKTCFSPFLTIHNKDKNRRKKLESNSCRKETKRKGREAS